MSEQTPEPRKQGGRGRDKASRFVLSQTTGLSSAEQESIRLLLSRNPLSGLQFWNAVEEMAKFVKTQITLSALPPDRWQWVTDQTGFQYRLPTHLVASSVASGRVSLVAPTRTVTARTKAVREALAAKETGS